MTTRTYWGPTLAVLGLLMPAGLASAEEDPFAAGEDALAVNASDGSASLRAKLKLTKMQPDMVQVRVTGLDDRKFPHCVTTAKVLRSPSATDKFLKLLGRGKTYRFKAKLKLRRGWPVLRDKMTQNNLGLCYYGRKTKLVLKISGVNLKTKTFEVGAVYAQ